MFHPGHNRRIEKRTYRPGRFNHFHHSGSVAGLQVFISCKRLDGRLVRRSISGHTEIGAYFGGIFGLFAIGKVIEASIKIIMLGWLNRILGLIFAILKCALILGLVIIMFDSINGNFHAVPEKTLSESILYPPLKDLANCIFPYLKDLLFK